MTRTTFRMALAMVLVSVGVAAVAQPPQGPERERGGERPEGPGDFPARANSGRVAGATFRLEGPVVLAPVALAALVSADLAAHAKI